MIIFYKRHYLFALTFFPALVSAHISFAQASNFFIKHGNNLSQVSCGGILFAPVQNQNHQSYGSGAVWLRNQIDLSKPFDISFILDFVDTTGVDGGAFVLQKDSSAVGDTYNGLGYRNINKSIAVTFDVKKTSSDNDPAFDHISIQKNGDTKHGSINELATPVSIEPFYLYQYYPPPDAPKWSFHRLVTVQWDPATELLQVFFDHNLVIKTQYDLVQNIFDGNPIVYWGFTASNTQEQSYPPTREMTFGYFYYFFGDIYPRYATSPELDTCYDKPIRFIDKSIYALDSFYNTIQLAKWYWSFGDGETSNLRFPAAHQFPKPGEYVIKFTVSNSVGCTFDTLVSTIHLGSVPNVDFIVDGAACANSPVIFRDKSSSQVGEVTAWNWTFQPGITSTDKNPIVSSLSAGFSSVNLRVRTFYGCEAEKTKTIEIGEKPIVDFNYTKDCQGIVSFVPTELNNAQIVLWHWLFGDGSASISMQPIHNYKENKFAVASLIAESNTGCISDTVSKNIFINRIYPFAGNDTILAQGEPLQLHASGGEHYQWEPSTGLSNPAIADPVVQITHDQLYIVHISNNDGCAANDSIMIKVYKGPEIYLPSGFSPNHDGRNDIFKPIGPGIQSLEYFRIYNRSGMLMFETKKMNTGWDGSFNGRAQPAGTYVWALEAVDVHGMKIFRKGIVVLVR